jgi:hypothetical protein
MAEVRQVIAHIHPPSPRIPTGQVAYGFYTVSDGLLTMTDAKGNPATDDEGKMYTRRLAEGDDAETIAARLTKELRLALQGKSRPVAGFGAPLNYPSNKKLGIV